MSSEPTISVIVPMYNAAHMIEECLTPLQQMRSEGLVDQLIVINDGSTDGSAAVVERIPNVELLHTERQSGPAAARNQAAECATSEYLWFVDADVILADDAGRILNSVLSAKRPTAVIGSYDQTPRATNFLSQYKNLVHHYYHQRAKEEASTFWSGCGVVEREAFLAVDGFDVERFPYPSVEDIDLGYRIRDNGGDILLITSLQGKHLKEWRLGGLLHTEIFRRAIPWAAMMLKRDDSTNDLNVSFDERMRAVSILVWGLCVLLALAGFASFWVPLVVGAGVVVINMQFLAFFARERGIVFAIRAFLFHQLYYVYSSLAYAIAVFSHIWNRFRSV